MSPAYNYHNITSQEIDCDVCIIGSGAGGATLAAGLVAKGLNVVMLESGRHQKRKDFNMDEAKAFSTLYQERGTRASSDLGIIILQGENVGGGKIVVFLVDFLEEIF